MRRLVIAALVAVVALGAGAAAFGAVAQPYTVSVVLPNATNLIEGGSVMRKGYEAGSIEDIKVENDKARLTLALDDEFGPLHEGAKVEVVWKAVLGERLVTIQDGPKQNAQIPAGGMLTGAQDAPVEFDAVLAALDAPTREKLQSFVKELSATLGSSEQDIKKTLGTAGPALKAMGKVLRGIGTDGAAIRQLVTQLNNTMGILAKRDKTIEQVVNELGDTTAATVDQRQALGTMLAKLPGTVRLADKTLGKVPGVVDDTMPLLADLRPVTGKLKSVSRNLQPVLNDLRPAVAQLRPTLDAASELLRYTPGLMDTGTATFPAADQAFRGLVPALNFLRPYTPEVMGWLSNWASATANYDANGHFARFFIQTGLEAANVNPGVTSPGLKKQPAPLPGDAVQQPWTDAFGSGMR